MKFKNSVIFVIYTALLGAVVGGIIWAFLRVMNIGITLVWKDLPATINIPYYTIVACLGWGIIIGLWKSKIGDLPEELHEVLGQVKKNGRYSYKKLFPSLISSLLSLIAGGSVGPEAGLTGIIAGLCTWVGDKLKFMFKEIGELTQIGVSATLGTIFRTPMFGFVEPIEGESNTTLPKISKIVLYFTAILSSFAVFLLLGHFFGGGVGIQSLEGGKVTSREWVYIIPLTAMGIIGGYIFFFSKKLICAVMVPLKNKWIIKGLIGGLLLGICGTILPFTMFSGEHQIGELFSDGKNLGIGIILATGIIKILLTNVCIETGFKGGHFFPLIFSGTCFGYAFSLISGIDPVFCMSISTAALVAHTLKKPIATILLLMIVFPISLIPVMLVAAVVSCIFKTPAGMVE